MKNDNFNKQIIPANKNEKIILHACCAPCCIEPYKILKDAGWDITIMYSNDNIFPKSEYEKRYTTLFDWAAINKAKLIKDTFKVDKWKERVLKFGEDKPRSEKRKLRCGECYQVRLENAAKYAVNNGIEYLASSLAVSPYQYNDLLEQRLNIVCSKFNLKPVFMDFRPYYSNATKKSIELKMYRQKYCGCELSYNESIEQFKRTKNKKYLKQLLSITQH